MIDYQSNGFEIPNDLQEWLIRVWERWQSGQCLSEAFEIFDSIAERRERRNIELIKYAAMLGNDRNEWEKAKNIAEQVKRIEQNRRDFDAQLKVINQIAKPPKSQKQIYRIIKNL